MFLVLIVVRSLITSLCVLLSGWVGAQNAVLTEFTADQVGEKVLIAFTFSKGNTCNDTQIQRANHSMQFQTIGSIPGVCGSNDKEESYSFVDSFPLYGETNFYRIWLSTLGVSDTIALDVKPASDNGIIVFPNPATDLVGIAFPEIPDAIIQVHDRLGRAVFSQAAVGRNLEVSLGSWQAGSYFVSLSANGRIVFQDVLIKL